MGLVMLGHSPGTRQLVGEHGKRLDGCRGAACPTATHPSLFSVPGWSPSFLPALCGQEKPKPVSCPIGAQETGLA